MIEAIVIAIAFEIYAVTLIGAFLIARTGGSVLIVIGEYVSVIVSVFLVLIAYKLADYREFMDNILVAVPLAGLSSIVGSYYFRQRNTIRRAIKADGQLVLRVVWVAGVVATLYRYIAQSG